LVRRNNRNDDTDMKDFTNTELERFIRSERNLKAESTLQNYHSGLTRFDDFLEREALDIDDVESNDAKLFMSDLAANLSDQTVSNYLTAVRKFYEHHLRDGAPNPVDGINTGDYLDLTSTQHSKPTLNVQQVKDIVDSADTKRAHAMLALMASSGMRVKEACQAKLSNLDLDERYVEIMTVKNNFGERKAYFDRKTRRMLNEDINGRYRDQYEGTDSDYIFLSKSYGQYDGNGHLSTDRAREDFRTAVTNSSVEPDLEEYGDGRERWTITTHILRKSFCQHWIDEDGDLMSLKNQVGWENIETAKQYIDDEATLDKRDKYGVRL